MIATIWLVSRQWWFAEEGEVHDDPEGLVIGPESDAAAVIEALGRGKNPWAERYEYQELPVLSIEGGEVRRREQAGEG